MMCFSDDDAEILKRKRSPMSRAEYISLFGPDTSDEEFNDGPTHIPKSTALGHSCEILVEDLEARVEDLEARHFWENFDFSDGPQSAPVEMSSVTATQRKRMKPSWECKGFRCESGQVLECIFHEDGDGKKASGHNQRRCIFCSIEAYEDAMMTPQGKGNIVRKLKRWFQLGSPTYELVWSYSILACESEETCAMLRKAAEVQLKTKRKRKRSKDGTGATEAMQGARSHKYSTHSCVTTF